MNVVSRKLMEVWDCWCVNLMVGWKDFVKVVVVGDDASLIFLTGIQIPVLCLL